MKEIHIESNSRKEVAEAQKEAQLLKTMRHPNIVKFIDSFVDKKEQLMCILMDYCDGGDLSDLVQKRKRLRSVFSEDEVMMYFVQICLAVRRHL